LVEEQGRTKLLERRCFETQKLEIGQQTLRDENESLKSKVDSLNNENETLMGKIDGVRLQKVLLSDEQEKEVASLRNDLHKEKRRCDAYKTKALELHTRSVKAKEVLDELCNNKKRTLQ
jgi:hypothetical protein